MIIDRPRTIVNIVIILKAGESIRPERLICVNVNCGRTMIKVNRKIAHTIKNNKGIHWSDLPDHITVVEHKCRGCTYYYKIYTPETVSAQAIIENKYNV